MVILYYGLIAFTAIERVAELLVSNANARWSLARGGCEYGRDHFPAMVALHSCFLASCVLEPWLRGYDALPAAAPLAFAIAAGCQALRWWSIATLGRQWNTRVLVVPGMPRVVSGPYRWLNHPNYVAVAMEGVALPVVGGAWLTAVLFTIGNLFLMRARLRTENRVLATLEPGGHHDFPATA